MYRILIFLEEGRLDNCLDLVGAADLIGKARPNYEIYGLGINLNPEIYKANLDYVINIKNEIPEFDVANVAKILHEVNKSYNFDCILICATTFGRMIAPRVAMRLETGLVADVTKLQYDDQQLMMIRPAFTGKIMAAVVCDKSPLMMSIRPKVFEDCYSHKRVAKDVEFKLQQHLQSQIKRIATEQKSESDDIRKSKLLISCGGGMGNKLDVAQALAKKLNGKLAVSRRPVDAGIADRNIQVGQSGKIVSPKIYVALGISGSGQHIDGLKNVESIISVNVDKNAPINHLSDIVVIGDCQEFVLKLLEKIESP